MKVIKVLALVVVIAVAGILAFATTKPDTFYVQRTATINAPPEKVAALIEDFHQWGSWSPWEKLDPAMKRTHSGAPRGQGATYAWEGNSSAGAGRMQIVEASASAVKINLDFIKPFENHCIAEFKLVPQGTGTQVTWSLRGPNHYLSKVMTTFFNMDEMVGGDFEKGLANLKAAAEKG